ncbi:MAG: hypothetical protein N3G80_03100 [Candidatus Micrarchaeota archaeon]|nr:hypothetical protein [Candidatus Micrarchaeota archaeon]
MADYIGILNMVLKIANIGIAAYLIWLVTRMYLSDRGGSFSNSLKIMLVALLLFFSAEFASTFRLIDQETQKTIDSLFFFVFLLLLLLALIKIRHSGLAHDHLVKKKLKAKIVDVE